MIRRYTDADWPAIEAVHDSARRVELAWLYVAPGKTRRGIGRALAEYALKMFPGIRYIEALKGNEPARALYESLGFRLAEIKKGHMAGNETFEVEGYIFEKQESLD